MSKRSHTARLAERQVKVAAQAADGAQGKDIAETLEVSPATICRDLLAIRQRAYPANEAELVILIAEQDAVLQLMEDKLMKGLPPDVSNAWLKIRQEYASLHGLNKPTKHVTATVDLNEQQSRYSRIMKACRGIFAEERWNEIIAYLESVPRDPNPFPTVGKIIEGKLLNE
jgi:hypothetical protein